MTVSFTEFTSLTVCGDRLATKSAPLSQMTFLLKKFTRGFGVESHPRLPCGRGP